MKKIGNILEKVQLVIGVVLLMTYIFCIAYQIIARFTTGLTAEFTEEVANYSFIWVVYMGTAIMLRHNKHFAFTSFSSKLKGKARYVNEMLVMLILLAFSVLIFVHGCTLTAKFWNWKFSALPQVRLGLAWLCLPVSGACSVYYCVENIVAFIRDPSSRKSEEEEELERLERELAAEGIDVDLEPNGDKEEKR